VNERVTRSRELVARGFAAATVTRVLQVSRQAVYRTPTPRTVPQRRPVTDPVEQAIVEVAEANQTDGYRMVTAFVRRKLGVPVNRKRVLRVMRQRKLIQRRRPLNRRKRPGFFIVERPRQLWQIDMTSIWVAEHGWTYLNAIVDCCTREIVGWELSLLCRRSDRRRRQGRQGIRDPAGRAHTRLRQRVGVHCPPLPREAQRTRDPPPQRRLPRPREPGIHRVLVRETQRTGGMAERIRDARRRETRDRRLRRPLPPPAPLGPRLQDARGGASDLGRSTKHRGLNCQHRRGAGHLAHRATPFRESRFLQTTTDWRPVCAG